MVSLYATIKTMHGPINIRLAYFKSHFMNLNRLDACPYFCAGNYSETYVSHTSTLYSQYYK